jgi:hypothetical protein
MDKDLDKRRVCAGKLWIKICVEEKLRRLEDSTDTRNDTRS